MPNTNMICVTNIVGIIYIYFFFKNRKKYVKTCLMICLRLMSSNTINKIQNQIFFVKSHLEIERNSQKCKNLPKIVQQYEIIYGQE